MGIRLTGALVDGHGRPYVLECQCQPKTYGLGWVQLAIVAHLGNAPNGFGGVTVHDAASGDLKEHGPPCGITVRDLASVVYGTPGPTANQLRTVQRNARRLEKLHLVDCWHGQVGVKAAGRPVSGLYVALRWHCDHLGGGNG